MSMRRSKTPRSSPMESVETALGLERGHTFEDRCDKQQRRMLWNLLTGRLRTQAPSIVDAIATWDPLEGHPSLPYVMEDLFARFRRREAPSRLQTILERVIELYDVPSCEWDGQGPDVRTLHDVLSTVNVLEDAEAAGLPPEKLRLLRDRLSQDECATRRDFAPAEVQRSHQELATRLVDCILEGRVLLLHALLVMHYGLPRDLNALDDSNCPDPRGGPEAGRTGRS